MIVEPADISSFSLEGGMEQSFLLGHDDLAY